MKKVIFVLSTILVLSASNFAFSQELGTPNPNELVVSDVDLTIIFFWVYYCSYCNFSLFG